jgi:hypothetical protein
MVTINCYCPMYMLKQTDVISGFCLLLSMHGNTLSSA